MNKFLTEKMLIEYTGNNPNAIIPILLNGSPIVRFSKKPQFLCYCKITKKKDKGEETEVSLGYATGSTIRHIVRYGIPLYRIEEIIPRESCKKVIGEIVSLPNTDIIQSEVITNIGRSSIGSVNYITQDYLYLYKYLTSGKEIGKTNFDKILSYAIEEQSKLDWLLRRVETEGEFSDIRSSEYLNYSNFSVTERPTLLTILSRLRGNNYNPSKRVDDMEVIINSEATLNVKGIIDEKLTQSEYRKIKYDIAGLVAIKNDFGENSISNIKEYHMPINDLFLTIMVNDSIYRDIFYNRSYSAYNNMYKIIKLGTEKFLLKDNTGTKTFKQIVFQEY